ncbi:MAG TPA: ABC transporter permease, partial [Chromatiaceae bacterium]|nr:ABC transporter permease [Chromatiaceae bacterium]
MELIRLTPWDLSICAALVGLLAALSWLLRLGIGRRLLIAAVRSVVQLMLLGMILKTLFAQTSL